MLRYPGVVHAGDNLTGEGEGDDEQISLDLQTLAAKNIWTVLFVVNIYNRTNNPVNFGMVDNEFCRLVDLDRKTEMCRYELDDMGYVDTANTLVMCKLFRVGANNNVWRMQALGTAFQLSLIHISEPTRLLSISYAVFCLKKKKKKHKITIDYNVY
eukprot:TRINITY_DN2021_c0_g1_i4.p1 TRINITY_DN2021_c0_g1~~TRINITY_DN2021_c0_g1_i4.p1  ORF type:complete len:156 (-),score=52.08 TRINITY_DN2021_c0_g1_i4:88-555(-)